MAITPNALFHADCIEVMTRLDSESIDLIYLDPPISMQEDTGSGSSGDGTSSEQLQVIAKVCQQAHRVLTPKGVLFFHAQPLSAFRIRLILNQVFSEHQFRNEIVWKYGAVSRLRRPGTEHDTILHYARSEESTDNPIFKPVRPGEIATRSSELEDRGPYTLADLTQPATDPTLCFEWQGVTPPNGRSWRYRPETLRQLQAEGRIHVRRKRELPRLKIFLNEKVGHEAETIWTDIPRLSLGSKENVHYATQKPLGLMERLICKGSDKGQIVLDPFCGSGTTVLAAERLGRQWMACDTSQEAIEITSKRFIQEFGVSQPTSFTTGDSESLRQYPIKSSAYRRVAVRIEDIVSNNNEPEFILNHEISLEETRHFEFKEIRSAVGAIDSIVNTADEYAVAFLNSEGGKIYWGIRDKDRTVVGVHLTYQERDKLRREVTSKLNQIEPRIDPSKYRIQLHQVLNEQGKAVQDTWVVEIVVPASDSTEPYYTGGGDAWVKVDGIKQKLKGIALTDFIKQRLAKGAARSQNADGKLIAAELVSELEDNFRTARGFTSGLPGNEVYLSPSIRVWKQYRNQLSFVDRGVLDELKQAYERIERWHGIVASGANPGIGNLEIPEITNWLRIRLPDLIAKLKVAVKV